MILYINTASREEVEIKIEEEGKILGKSKFKAAKRQSEKLLPKIDNLLEKKGIKLKQIKKIVVVNQGGSFTSLRVGVVTANALAYALKIPVEGTFKSKKKTKKFSQYSIVEPIYDSEPIIGKSKK